MRLIDADALHSKICEDSENNYGASVNIAQVLLYIEIAPTIEAEPVRHGRWIVRGQEIYCSECNEESLYNPFGASKFSRFCPNCGADMRKEGADNA